MSVCVRVREIIATISQLWVFEFHCLLIYLVVYCSLGLSLSSSINSFIYTLPSAEVYVKMTSFYKLIIIFFQFDVGVHQSHIVYEAKTESKIDRTQPHTFKQ